MALTIRLNGEDREVTAEPGTPLLWVIRDELKAQVTRACSSPVTEALAFLMVGLTYERTHSRHIPHLGGLAKKMPIGFSRATKATMIAAKP